MDFEKYYEAPRPDHVPANRQEEAVLIGRARQYATACGDRWGWLLPHMSTENSARDMDRIRAALGESKISYLGYSYGTYLGAVYATLFPERVKRLVLDSVVDPRQVWYGSNLDPGRHLRPAAPRLSGLDGPPQPGLQAWLDGEGGLLRLVRHA